MGLRTRLAAALELPSEVFGGMQVVVRAREEVEVAHCRKILVYSTTEILLRLADGKLRVVGENLTVMRYLNGNMKIQGQIDKLIFAEKAEGGDEA